MAKALVFEGCPACERKSDEYAGYGQRMMAVPVMDVLKTGAIGAGGVIAFDMILPRFLPAVTPLVRSLLTGGLVLASSYFLKDRQPEIAAGIALGGGSIVVYKVVASLMGRVVPATGAVAGLGRGTYGEEMYEVEESPYGVLVAEDLGQEEIIVE